MAKGKEAYDPRAHLMLLVERVRKVVPGSGVIRLGEELKSAELAAQAGPLEDVQRHINNLVRVVSGMRAGDKVRRAAEKGDRPLGGTRGGYRLVVGGEEVTDPLVRDILRMPEGQLDVTRMLASREEVTVMLVRRRFAHLSSYAVAKILASLKHTLGMRGLPVVSERVDGTGRGKPCRYSLSQQDAKVLASALSVTDSLLCANAVEQQAAHVAKAARGLGCAGYIKTVVELLVSKEKISLDDVALAQSVSRTTASTYMSITRGVLASGGVFMRTDMVRRPRLGTVPRALSAPKHGHLYYLDAAVRKAAAEELRADRKDNGIARV